MAVNIVEEMMSRTNLAAEAFESIWTLRALKRVDEELGDALEDQVAKFNKALVTQSRRQVKIQGEALIRGYAVCVKAMQEARAPDDAYLMA